MNPRIALILMSLGSLPAALIGGEPIYQGKTISEWVKLPDVPINVIRSFEEWVEVGAPLVVALQDKNLKVREAALINLEKISENPGHRFDLVVPLLLALKDPDPKIREKANRLLDQNFSISWFPDRLDDFLPAVKKLGATAVPIFTQGLKQKIEFVQGVSAVLLGSMGSRSKEAVPALESLLLDEKKHRLRGDVAVALCQIGPAGLSSIKKALRNSEESIRLGAVYGLSRFPPKKAEDFPDLLLEVLKDTRKDDDLCQKITTVLKNLKVPTEPKNPLLLDPDPFVQIWFAYHLEQEKTVPRLVQAMDNSDGRIRRKAVEILRQEKAVEGLVQGLKNKDPEVRQLAIRGLAELGPAVKPFLPGLAECLGDDDLIVSGRARQILVKFGADSVPFFLKTLQDRNPKVRRSAVFALGQIGPPAKEAVPLLVEMLKNDDQGELAWEIRRALKKISPQEK